MGVALDGVLVCDKPAGMTSHDVVARVRRIAGQRRVGHGGTLDPPATGVLVVALGRATRLLPFLPTEPKRYLATIAFGTETDTLDADGTVTATAPTGQIHQEGMAAALARLIGPQLQVPPMVSAVKLGGERLYAKARRGETVDRAPRPITIHALDLLRFEDQGSPAPRATVAVTCSGGTYVRVLAADLGRAPGSLAHLASLRRTAVGAFTEDAAHALDQLEGAALQLLLLSPADAMGLGMGASDGAAPAAAPARALSDQEAAALATGKSIDPSGRAEPVAAIAPDGHLVAVIQDGAGRARPRVVLE
ncbi:MAG TPA: tRNA pseudouridine(55) synthase TruB [Actinomycetota bacterium]